MSAGQTFGPAELARATGCSPAIAALAFETLRPPELLYRPLTETETAAAVAGIESVIRDKPLRTVGGDDPAVWERGWGELADQLASQTITTHTLRPQYYHGEVPCRLFGGLVEQVTPDFEYWVGLCVRVATFAEFLKERASYRRIRLRHRHQSPAARAADAGRAPCRMRLGDAVATYSRTDRARDRRGDRRLPLQYADRFGRVRARRCRHNGPDGTRP